MSMKELLAALSDLDTGELKRIESRITELYRQRGEGIVFDDDYGIWTEDDQAGLAAESLATVDSGKAARGK
jgi:hypothetical protein